MLRLLSFVCLLSVVNCVNLGFFGYPSIGTTQEPDVLPQVVEVIRWRQPVCVIPAPGVPPCFLGLRQLQTDYDHISSHIFEDELAPRRRVKKTVETSEVREKINLDEIAPSSLVKSSIEIREKSVVKETPPLDFNNENLEVGSKRHYPRGISTYPGESATGERPLPIYVTKVINSPVTATLVADNCLPDIGVPLCEDYEEQQIIAGRHNKQAELPLKVPVLELKNKLSMFKLISDFFHKPSLALNATSSAVVGNTDGVVTIDVETTANGETDQNTEIPIAFTENNPTVAKLVADDLLHKKEKIVEAIENKKEHITGAVASLAAVKQGIVEGIVDKKEHVVDAVTAAKQGFAQEIIHKKEQVSEAVTAVKQGIVQGIVDKKDKVIEAVTTVKQGIEQGIAHKKEQVAEAVAGVSAVKEGFVQGIVDKKHEAVQAIVNVATEKKAALENMKHNAFQTAANVVARKHQIVQNMKDSVTQTAANIIEAKQHIVEEIAKKKHDAVEAVVEAATNMVAMKKGIVDGIVKKKHDAVEAVVDAASNVVSTKKGIVEGIVKKKHDAVEAVVGAASNVVSTKKGIVEGIVKKKHDAVEAVVGAASNVVSTKKGIVEGIVKKKHESFQDLVEKIRRKHQIMRDLKIMVIRAIVDAAERRKQALLATGQHVKDTALNVTAKKQQMIKDLSRAIVHGIIDAANNKKEAVQGVKQHTKDFVVNTATRKHQVIRELKKMIINSVVEASDKKHQALASVKETIANAAAEKKEAVANAIEEKQMLFRKMLAKTHEILQGILDAKINFELDLADKKQQLIQSITDSKVAVINSMADKKQGIVKQIADKKTDAIKKLSEKSQEFISTASLAKPLLISTIKQTFGSNQDDQANNNEGRDDDDLEITTVADDLAIEASPVVDDRLTEVEEVTETTDAIPTDDSENATDAPQLMSRKSDNTYFDKVESTDDSIPDMHEVMGEIFGDAFTYSENERPDFRMFQRFPPLYSMSPLPGSEKKQDSPLGLLGILQTVTNKKFASIADKIDQINQRIEKIFNTAGLSMQPPTTTTEPTTTTQSSFTINKPSVNNVSTVPDVSQLPALLGLLGLPAAAAVAPQAIPALQAIGGLQALSNLLPTALPTPIPHDPVDEDEEGASPVARPTPKPQVPWDGTLVVPPFDDSNNNQLQEHFDDIDLDPAASAFIKETSLSENVVFDPTPNESTHGETRMNTSANVNEVNNGTTLDEEPAIDIVYRPESSTVVQDNNKDEKPKEIVVHSVAGGIQEYSETESPQDSIITTEDPIYFDEEEEKVEEESEPCVACQIPAQFAYPRQNVAEESYVRGEK